jgi:hypothetical protein
LLAPTTELTLPQANVLNLLDKPEDNTQGNLAA